VKPDFAAAYLTRGHLYRLRGQYELAAASYEKAAALRPDSGQTAFDLGLLDFLRGQYAAAADDFARANHPDSVRRYSVLWLYLARARSGQAMSSISGQADSGTDEDHWPAPLFQFYLGKLTEEEVRHAAASTDAEADRGQRCEADFYIGELRLVQGDASTARKLLEQSRTECPETFIEYEIAPVELKRLDGQAALVQKPASQ